MITDTAGQMQTTTVLDAGFVALVTDGVGLYKCGRWWTRTGHTDAGLALEKMLAHRRCRRDRTSGKIMCRGCHLIGWKTHLNARTMTGSPNTFITESF